MKRFGYREIIATVIGIACFYFSMMVQNVISWNVFGNVSFGLYIPMLIMAVIAAIFGTFSGLATGVGALVLTIALLRRPVQYIEAFNIFIFCLSLGSFHSRYKVLKGQFGLKEAIDYNVMQVALSILTWVLIHPIMSYIVFGRDLVEELTKGLGNCAGTAIILMIVGTMVMFLFSEIVKIKNKLRKNHMQDGFEVT